MSRTLNVVRLQLINKQTYVWIPLIVLAGAVVISLLIYAIIPIDTPKYGGGGQAPLWYFFAVGIQALTLSFPFSQAMSVTRREFFFGTMLTAVAASALLGVIFILGGWIEMLTGGWWLNGYIFYLPWLWEAGALSAGLMYFALSLLLFLIGFSGATVYKRWGGTILAIAGFGVGLLLVAIVFVLTRWELWGTVIDAIISLGALGLAGMVLILTVALAAISFWAMRKAIP